MFVTLYVLCLAPLATSCQYRAGRCLLCLVFLILFLLKLNRSFVTCRWNMCVRILIDFYQKTISFKWYFHKWGVNWTVNKRPRFVLHYNLLLKPMTIAMSFIYISKYKYKTQINVPRSKYYDNSSLGLFYVSYLVTHILLMM